MFLPGESQGRQSLVGCRPWGHTESDTTEATEQQQCLIDNKIFFVVEDKSFRTCFTYWFLKVYVKGFSMGATEVLSTAAAAATAKSLQSCLTLCDPIDGSPPGSPVPGILQARTLEWVAISFSNA